MIFNIVTYKPKPSIIPTALSATGSWTNSQYVGSAMDTTGLTFTVTYSNGSTASVTPVKSPAVWAVSGVQNATFTYTESGVTVSATKSVTVENAQTIIILNQFATGTEFTGWRFV